MDAQYDDERVTLTPGFIAALETLMREQMAMMAARNPAYAECWTWGQCTVRDLSVSSGLEFTFGENDEKPVDMVGDVRVICVQSRGKHR